MHIEYLADHPEFIPTVAQWLHVQFSYLSPGSSVERRIAGLGKQLAKGQMSITFLALSGDTPLGTASLTAHDMDTRMELSPWLASVYVAPEYRRQGTGTALVQRVADEAKALGFETLYLYTPDQEAFYARRGWSTIEHVQYRGYEVSVMELRL
jgi:GNAT superfamily N-acetyltransferase